MNSPLATYTVADKDSYGKRDHVIDTITPHCFACQVTAQRGANALIERTDAASANYIVGYDGTIAVNVDEDKGSKCSSNRENDMRAVTIEVSCESTHPYAITDKAYSALIELMADICQRNGIKKLVWSTSKTDRVNHKNGCNITVHRDYAAKACPGDYIYNRMGEIAAAVNNKIEEDNMTRYTTIDDVPAGAYRELVEEYIAEGTIKGKTDGTIDLSEDMIRSMIFNKRHNDKLFEELNEKLDGMVNDIAAKVAQTVLEKITSALKEDEA